MTGLAASVLVCPPTFADSISYSLNTPNLQLSSSPGPYGTVDLNLNTNGTISVLVTMTSAGIAGTYGIGGGGPAFGLNGPAGLSFSGFTLGFSCCQPSGNGYGGFSYVIGGAPPGGGPRSVLNFVVTAPGRFTSISQLGNNFMAHVIPPGGVQTGYATVTVPDGDLSPVVLLAMSLFGLLFLQLVFRRKIQAGSN